HRTKFLSKQHVENLPLRFASQIFAFAKRAEQSYQSIGADFIINSLLERAFVFNSALNSNAVETSLIENFADGVQSNKIEQQVGCEIAAARDHCACEVRNPGGSTNHFVNFRI